MKPLILINFKTYEKATGNRALELAKLVDRVAREEDANIAISVDALSLYRISSQVNLPVFVQHVDPVGFGSNTGHVLAESARDNGAVGVLLNHSERRMDFSDLAKTVERCKKVGLVTVVCVQDVLEAEKILELSPNFIAFEDPELIGSGTPISKAMPEKVREFSKLVTERNQNVIPLCGAGISTGDDAKSALELGAKGVLLASAFVNSENPENVLRDLVKAVKIPGPV